MEGDWTLAFEHFIVGNTPFSLYQSKHSKLRVAIADVRGPLVKGVVSFLTPPTNDDGLPNAVSKLINMGSDKYPFRNILEDTQHLTFLKEHKVSLSDIATRYSYTTVGSEGFLKVLPVQLDSLFCPLLSEDAFVTEIHHINQRGSDAGKMYEEQKAKESDMNKLVIRKYRETVYPNGNPYRYDPYGRAENIRNGCTLEQIREFHKQYYHLNNAVITVCGTIDHQTLLKAITEIEKPLISKIPSTFVMPKMQTTPSITKTASLEFECPNNSGDLGQLTIFWNLPSTKDYFKYFGMVFLCDYMTKALDLNTDETDFTYNYDILGYNEISFTINGTPFTVLEDFHKDFKNEIGTFIAEISGENFKPEMFNNKLRQAISNSELYLLDSIPAYVLRYQTNDMNFEEFSTVLDFTTFLKKILKGSQTSWDKLMSSCFGGENLQILAKPSKQLARDLAAQEKQRLQHQKEQLGEEGKKKLSEKLERIRKDIDERKVLVKEDRDKELMEKLTVHHIENINLIDVVQCTNLKDNTESTHTKMTEFLSKIKFSTFLHCVPTSFIQVVIFIDSRTLKNKEWMLLLLDQVFKSPAEVGNIEMSAEYVEQMVSGELESLDVKPSIVNPYIELRMRSTAENWSEMRKLAELYYTGTIFDGKRIVEGAKRLIERGKENAKNAEKVINTLMMHAMHDDEEVPLAKICDPIYLTKFHEYVAKKAAEKPAWAADQLEIFRESLISADINMHIICDEKNIPNFEGWEFLHCKKKITFAPEIIPLHVRHKHAHCYAGKGIRIQMLRQFMELTEEEEKSLLKILLYMNITNGKIAKVMDKLGLADHSQLIYDFEHKWIELCIFKSYKIQFAHYQTMKTIQYMAQNDRMSDIVFEKHRRKFIRDLFGEVKDVQGAIENSIYSSFRKQAPDHLKKIAIEAMSLKREDVLEKGTEVLQRFYNQFHPVSPDNWDNGTPVVVAPANKEHELQCYFHESAVKIEHLYRPQEETK